MLYNNHARAARGHTWPHVAARRGAPLLVAICGTPSHLITTYVKPLKGVTLCRILYPMIQFLTRHAAHSSGHPLVEAPAQRNPSALQLHALQLDKRRRGLAHNV